MAPLMVVHPACVHGCTLKGAHAPGCGSDGCTCACHTGGAYRPPCDVYGGCRCGTAPDCPGCAPRPAMPGALVCVRCWDDTTSDLADLPDLYAELLEPARTTGVGRVSGTSEARLPLTDDARWTRDWIVNVLWVWVDVLASPREPPQAQRDAWRAATKRGETPAPLPAAPYGRGLTIPATRDPRVTVPLLERHMTWLVGEEAHADQVVTDITAMHRSARSTAVPAAHRGVTIGVCPVLVQTDPAGTVAACGATLHATTTTTITCPGCGTKGDAVWWWNLLDAGATDVALADGRTIAAFLSAEYQRPVTPEVIRQWASAGTKAGRLPRVGKDRAGRTLHPVAEARRLAATIYTTGGNP